ncbi:MAG: glycosyltransferase [Gammaproteobacteria bacterium]|nr:glycosyltransferase [Gammaproteobacteria bacterium]
MKGLLVKEGNSFFRKEKYFEAIKAYEKLLIEIDNGCLAKSVEINLEIARKRLADLDFNSLYSSNVEKIAASDLFDDNWYLEKYFKGKSEFFCQRRVLARHYLEEGANKGYDPSEVFSSKDYLSLYPSVKIKGMNPLLHYLMHGQQKGYKTKRTFLSIDQDDSGLVDVYISCWLRDKESLHDRIVDIYDELRSLGKRVKIITHSEYLLKVKNIDFFNVPFDLLGASLYDGFYSDFIPKEAEVDILEILKLKDLNAENESYKEREVEFKTVIRKAYSYWHSEFSHNSPSCVLVWGSTCPMSRLHIHLCNQLNIPYLVLERGHFPKSISVDTFGQFARGGSQRVPSEKIINNDFYEKCLAWIKSNEEVPYKNKNKKIDINDIIKKKDLSNKKIILFIGVNDNGSGLSYSSDMIYEKHSTSYHSTYLALKDLELALKEISDVVLIVKPHPSDRSITRSEFPNVFIEPEANIDDLIKASDVCVTLSTTAIARCVFEEKPLVTMCESDVTGKNIAYESNDASSLLLCLRAAIHKDEFAQKRKNAKLYLQELFSRRLIFSKRENDFFCNVSDLAKRISRLGVFYNKVSFKEPLNTLSYSNYSYGGKYSVARGSWKDLCVVMPVYSDAKVTKYAIDSVLSSIQDINDARLLIVNDCSPEEEVLELLETYRYNDKVKVSDNEKNLGFSGAVNRGIMLSGDSDVLLFNSDAVISNSNSINFLREAAYSHFKTATVTPFSNNAGICSVPLNGGFPLELSSANYIVGSYAKKLENTSGHFSVELPVGHGFCLYIRRSALEQLNVFDEIAFGLGYSEEIDFCLRARAAGFKNLLASNVFVGHIGGVSFKDNANDLRMENRKIIKARYPWYFNEIKEFMKSDPLKSIRPTYLEL